MKGGKGFGIVPTHLRGHLTAIEIAVYVALSWRADNKGSAWPSHATIAEEAGTSVNSVKRALESIRDKGLVHWEARTDPRHGGPSSNQYWIEVRTPSKGGSPQGPTPQASEGYELDPDEAHSFIAASRAQPSADADAAIAGPRDRAATEIDVDALVSELEDDIEATGLLAKTWADGTEALVEHAIEELRDDPRVNDPAAWLERALAPRSPVGKVDRLLRLVGDDE